MSYISKLVAEKLGGLNSKTLSLKNGLNIVYGSNEAGKSTWAAMIKMMFYGWGSKKDEKKDYDKYCKDSNFLIRAFIEDYNGKQLYMERAKKDTCKAVFPDNGKVCAELTGSMPGIILFGVDRETFEKTSFIGQMQLETGKTDEIENKLATILKTGDAKGQVSFEEARKVLDDVCKEISGTRGSSRINNIRDEIANLTDTLEKNRRLLMDLNSEKVNLEEKQKLFSYYTGISNANETINAKDAIQTISSYRRMISDNEKTLMLKKELIMQNGIFPDNEFVNNCEQCLRNCENYYEGIDIIDSEIKTATQELKNTRDKLIGKEYFLKNDISKKKAEVEALKITISVQTQLKELEQKVQETNKLKKPVKSKWMGFVVLGVVFTLLMIASIVLIVSNFTSLPGIALIIVSFGVAVFEVIKILWSSKGTPHVAFDESILKVAFAQISFILSQAKCRDVEEFEYEMNYCYDLVKDVEFKEKMLEKIKNRISNKRQEFVRIIEEFKNYSKNYFVNYEDMIAINRELNSLKSKLSTINSLEYDIKNIKLNINALLINNTEEQLKYLADRVVEEFDLIEADGAKEKANVLDEEIRNLREGIAAKTAMLKTKGRSLDDIEMELTYQSECMEEYIEKDDAVKIALEILYESYQEFSSKYAPELAKRAQEIFGFLTDAKYDTANINADFKMVVSNSKTSVRFGENKLSTGTLEQLWLSLRLALVEIIYDKSEMKPPLVLDDTLVNFDEERCFRALDYLLEISSSRQVILFTCHKREFEYFVNNANVNLIKLAQLWAI